MQTELKISLDGKGGKAQSKIGNSEQGCYFRTTGLLSAKTVLECPCSARIRLFTAEDANALIGRIRKRNVFARHSSENSFYLKRIQSFENKTLIEVYRPGQPDEFAAEANQAADFLEELALLSSPDNFSKAKLLRALGIASRSRTEVEFMTGDEDRYLRSRTRSMPDPVGISIDERFCKRFHRYGFGKLFEYGVTKQGLAKRILSSTHWLFESSREPKLEAAFVKSSVSLESLLIFSESEALARSLSERAAFILSPEPERRQQISTIIKKFYEARSGIVHGSREKAKHVTLELLETTDQLLTMLNLTIANNPKKWPSQGALRDWCESERWGAPSHDAVYPFPDSYLRKSLGAHPSTATGKSTS